MEKLIQVADREINKIKDQMDSNVRLKINSFLPKEGRDNYDIRYDFVNCILYKSSNQLWSVSNIHCNFMAFIKIPGCNEECFKINMSLKNNLDVFVGSIRVKEN